MYVNGSIEVDLTSIGCSDLMLLDVCKVVLLPKLDAGSRLERLSGQVMQKVLKMMPNGRLEVPLGAPWGSENDTNRYKRCYFACVC